MVDLVAQLSSICGPDHVLTGEAGGEFGRDTRGIITGPVVAAVRPADTAEVAQVVRACAEATTPICTLGGNTGLSGGGQPVPDQPSVVLSLARLNRIESVDADGSTATVQAGVTIEAIQDAAAAAGRMFPPDWGARGTATIGGAISTNAGGINVLQYGPTRDHVLGLEVVLADGRVWDGMTALRKDSTGYQLRQLFVGAEGTLGIITRAVVRLTPAVHDEASALLAVPDIGSVLPLLATARSGGGTVTAFELMPRVGLERAVERFELQQPLALTTPWYVLLRVATPQGVAATDALGAILADAAEMSLIDDAVVAATADQTDALWLIRDELPPTQLWDNLDGYLKYDTAVPVSSVSHFIERVEQLVAEIAPSWRPYSFGHVGDGNIHLHVMPPADGGWDPGDRTALRDAIDSLTFSLRGSLSAEHGVGQDLLAQVAEQKSELDLELAWRIKNALDPHAVFNPGKTLPRL